MNQSQNAEVILSKKKIIIEFLLIFSFISISFLIYRFDNINNQNNNSNNSGEHIDPSNFITNLTQTIDFGNGTIENQKNLTIYPLNSTVFNLLNKYYTIEFQEFSYGRLVISINSVEQNKISGKYWQFWVNDEYSTVGSDSYQLKNDDVINWVYGESNQI